MELIVFCIIWAILVLGVFMDVRDKLFGQRRTLIIGASIIAGAILVASDKVAFQERRLPGICEGAEV